MEFDGIKGKLYRMSEYVMAIAYLNILWILFTLVGGVILGIHPATAAMFKSLKEWRDDEADSVSFTNFKNDFKAQFKHANILGVFLNILIFMVAFNGMLVYTNREIIHPALMVVYIVSVVLATVILLFAYPVHVYYKNDTKTTFVYSLIVGMSHPFTTIVLLVLSLLIAITIYSTSGLPLFFGISLSAFIIMKFTYRVFSKMDEKISTDTMKDARVISE